MSRFPNNPAAGILLAVTGLALVASPAPPVRAESKQGKATAPAGASVLTNKAYRVTLSPTGTVDVAPLGAAKNAGGTARFEPEFAVLFRADDPKIALRGANTAPVRYNVPSWEVRGAPGGAAPDNSLEQKAADIKVQAGDGFDPAIQTGAVLRRTGDLFRAADTTVKQRARRVRAEKTATATRFVYEFDAAADSACDLGAVLDLPPGDAPPRLRFTVTPKRAGWFSVGYTGAPSVAPAALDALWQPLVWTERRFPNASYCTPAYHGTLPGTLTQARGGLTVGVFADPAELPFQPLPTFDNSGFGMVLRDAVGDGAPALARPMLFAPLLGGVGSERKPGQAFSFSVRLVAQNAPLSQTFERTARGLFGFRDYRENVRVSLNTTLDNMIAYGMNDKWSRFNRDLKGFSYETDVPGTVKNVSALHPLSVALVTDDEAVFRDRAYPMIEYLLSRERFLFSLSPDVTVQNPSWRLLGPSASVSELATLSAMTGNRSPLLLRYADTFYNEKTRDPFASERGLRGPVWQNALALYDATGDKKWLARAKGGATTYLEKTRSETAQTTLPSAFFWSAFVPDIFNLSFLADVSGEPKYRVAAARAARTYAQFTWFAPRIPSGDVAVNAGGKAPVYWYLAKRTKGPIAVPEETIPAWRVSEVGLTPESSGTSGGHRGIFLSSFAPWFLHLGAQTDDPFLKDVGRSAVVGRYENFPGYHMNTARTTVYEKPDYPLRPFEELSYNSFHFNHIWAHAAMLVDYLVTDADMKSGGAISFPARFSEGYAFIKTRLYGDRPGVWYNDKNVYLFLGKNIVTCDNPQLNYVLGRGETGGLYIALCNQSPSPATARVHIDQARAGLAPRSTSAALVRTGASAPAVAQALSPDGDLTVTVPPGGIASIKIPDARVRLAFQEKWFAATNDQTTTWATDEIRAPTLGGDAVGMILNFGPELTHAFVYLQGTNREIKSARLRYTDQNNQTQTLTDAAYPFEFTIPLPPTARAFTYDLELTPANGSATVSVPTQRLQR